MLAYRGRRRGGGGARTGAHGAPPKIARERGEERKSRSRDGRRRAPAMAPARAPAAVTADLSYRAGAPSPCSGGSLLSLSAHRPGARVGGAVERERENR
jgi:hypothetical protein